MWNIETFSKSPVCTPWLVLFTDMTTEFKFQNYSHVRHVWSYVHISFEFTVYYWYVQIFKKFWIFWDVFWWFTIDKLRFTLLIYCELIYWCFSVGWSPVSPSQSHRFWTLISPLQSHRFRLHNHIDFAFAITSISNIDFAFVVTSISWLFREDIKIE